VENITWLGKISRQNIIHLLFQLKNILLFFNIFIDC
jgi:hypothetical protein